MSESAEAPGVIVPDQADMQAAEAEALGSGDAEVVEETGGPFSGKTAWVRRMETPRRPFLRAETGSAAILAGATVLALIWANMSISGYDRFWATRLAAFVGGSGVTVDLREFVNSGLMALFFLGVGLEARREFDVGELRIRSRLTLPLLVGLTGMAVPVSIFLIANSGRPAMHRCGMSTSTDTAFALGALGCPAVPRAAPRRAGPVGGGRGARRDLTERPAGPAVPPVDQLRHRAVVRAGQRGHRAERHIPGPGLHRPGHAGHHRRVPGGQAAGHGRVRLPGPQAHPRPGAAARHLRPGA